MILWSTYAIVLIEAECYCINGVVWGNRLKPPNLEPNFVTFLALQDFRFSTLDC